eukprot:14453787-Heterocapsa_arctica.AAC.1
MSIIISSILIAIEGVNTVAFVQARSSSEAAPTCPTTVKDNVMFYFPVPFNSIDWFAVFSSPKD